MADLCGSDELPSGTRILWENVQHSRTFSLGFFFPSGSRSDPPELSGLAHLVEHLVFKGTRSFSASELARQVDRVGGDLNAWTDREEMAFTCTVPAEHWTTAVEALVELCVFPTFPIEEFDREKEVIRNEILASLEDPEELAYEDFLQGLDAGPWTRSVAGSVDSLARLSRAAAIEWHRVNIAPLERLTVVVAGQVPVDEFRERLGHLLPRSSRSPTPSNSLPVFSPRQICRISPADFQMVQVLAGWHFPRPETLREATIWQVFSMIWGETMSSRLFQNLRERHGLCYNVSSHVFDTDGAWGLHFFATGAPENALPLVKALKEELDRLLSEPPTASEWDDARRALRGGMILGAERMENRVSRLWRFAQAFGRIESLEATVLDLEHPVTNNEQSFVLDRLKVQTPSLLVWGKTRLRSASALSALWHD